MQLPNIQMDSHAAKSQAWLTTVKPTIASLILGILIAVPLVIYKPILLLAIIPAYAIIGFVWYKFANWSLKRMRAKHEVEVREHEARVAEIKAEQAAPLE